MQSADCERANTSKICGKVRDWAGPTEEGDGEDKGKGKLGCSVIGLILSTVCADVVTAEFTFVSITINIVETHCLMAVINKEILKQVIFSAFKKDRKVIQHSLKDGITLTALHAKSHRSDLSSFNVYDGMILGFDFARLCLPTLIKRGSRLKSI